jgi:hypothetical protein
MNSTVGGGLGFYQFGVPAPGVARGGGIFSTTDFLATNSLVVGNVAANGGTNIFGSLIGSNNLTNGQPLLAPLGHYGGRTLTAPPLPGSPAIDGGGGGAIFTTDQRGLPRLVGALADLGAVEANGSELPGVDYSVVTTASDNLSGFGGVSLRLAVANVATNGTVTFHPSLSDATITLSGGHLVLAKNLTIDASALARPVVLDGLGTHRIFTINAGATGTLDSLVITNGFGWQRGGGVENLGTLTLRRCTVIGNYSDAPLSSGPGGGGGLYNGGVCTIESSTIANNSVGPQVLGGGGIMNEGTLTLNQCTVAGNDGHFGNFGGGGVLAHAGVMAVNQSTVSGNTAFSFGDGFYVSSGAEVTVSNSIVAGNAGNDFYAAAGLSLLGVNLTNVAPQLAPLGDYGGPTPTMPPLFGSPALNACTNGTGFATDQRGLPRVFGAAADLGAVEVQVLFPVADTLPATNIYNTTATLRGMVNPGGRPAVAWFEWQFDGMEFSSAPESIGSGTNNAPFSQSIGGLIQGAPYLGRVVVSNELAVARGGWLSFGSPTLYLSGPDFLTIECHSLTSAPTIPNPGFEADVFTNFPGYIAGNGPITGWTASGEAGLNTASGPFADNGAIPQGFNAAFLQSFGTPMFLETTITGLTPGQVYRVHFRANSRAATIAPAAYLSSTPSFFIPITASPAVGESNAWYFNQFDFIAGHTTMPLTVANYTLEDSALLVDDFTIEPLATNFAGGFYVSGNVNPSVPGNYPVIYSMTNAGAVSQATQWVAVVDTAPPVITLHGPAFTNITLNSAYTEPGATALDLCGGALAVVTNGVVNTAVIGVQVLTFTATDPSGHATTNTRTVVVTEPGVRLVATTNDAGPGSLRAVIAESSSGETIRFASHLAGTRLGLFGGLTLDKNLTIDGGDLAPGVTISANGGGRVLTTTSGTTNVLIGLTIADGLVSGGFGETVDGGGIHNSGHLIVRRCAVLRCRVSGSMNGTSRGGGIFNAGFLALEQSTFSENQATGHFYSPFDDGANAFGGAVYNAGAVVAWHLTIAGNTAYPGPVVMGNPGTAAGGGLFNAGTLSLSNSILAGNGSTSAPDIAGPVTTGGQNLTGVDPMLWPLGDYGGPTPTMPLRRWSPALNTCFGGTPFSTDQRGFPRPVGGAADIGAYETGTWSSNYQAFIWEAVNDATTNLASRAPGFDFDGDGASNHDEWIALTDPAKPASVFRASVVLGMNQAVVQFSSAAGRHYTLWSAPAASGPWTNSGLPALAGNGFPRAFTNVASGPMRFFRVQVAP